MKQQENNKQSVMGVKIKTEPGTSSSPVMQRLPSLRPPRDLSLSAYSQKIPNLNQSKKQKVYIPNLNVQRNKPTENVTVKAETNHSVKANLTEKSERGRGRGKRNLVQLSAGVFAEGIPGQRSNSWRGGRGGGGGGGDAQNMLKRPTLKLKENVKIDKEEEENTMKQLLRDDFIDDPSLEPDFDNCPITLPLKCKEDPGLKKKCDIKPDIKELLTVNDVFCGDITTTNPGYIFFQLPSSMPGLRTDGEVNGPQVATSSDQPSSKPAVANERCLISSLPGGQIGKLQILKSGRARLVFGDTMMWIEMGTQNSFKEHLVVNEGANKETHTSNLVKLGPVLARMVATPDWKALLAQARS